MLKTLSWLEPRSAQVRGLETAWLEGGRPGAPIALLLHGYPDTPDTWREQAAPLMDTHWLLLPFARGLGGSRAPARMDRYGAYAALLDHLELLRLADPERRRPVHVVGHDIGGVHAWMLATYAPPNLRSVTVLNSAHPRQFLRRLLWPRQVFKSWYVAALQLPRLPEWALRVVRRRLLERLASEGWKAPDGGFGLEEFEGAALNAMNEYRQFVREIPMFLSERSAIARVPVQLIASREDPYLEPPSFLELSDLAENLAIRVVRGGHWLHRQQPERVHRLLKEFWARWG